MGSGLVWGAKLNSRVHRLKELNCFGIPQEGRRLRNLRFGGDGGGAEEESKSVGENGVMGESREGKRNVHGELSTSLDNEGVFASIASNEIVPPSKVPQGGKVALNVDHSGRGNTSRNTAKACGHGMKIRQRLSCWVSKQKCKVYGHEIVAFLGDELYLRQRSRIWGGVENIEAVAYCACSQLACGSQCNENDYHLSFEDLPFDSNTLVPENPS
ncbi:hypothetical protein SASPL_154727 [Salvia splendens]|uniref:Uncharacterized protein n=1 Tax=Salvia splendens TaxID=180675 RepID=A0A8X8W122_SALSN|nr:hypothetical protein SASPL_154727 [Salvia splendens]